MMDHPCLNKSRLELKSAKTSLTLLLNNTVHQNSCLISRQLMHARNRSKIIQSYQSEMYMCIHAALHFDCDEMHICNAIISSPDLPSQVHA